MKHFRRQNIFPPDGTDPLTGETLFYVFRRVCAAIHPRSSSWPPGVQVLSKFCGCPSELIVQDTAERDGFLEGENVELDLAEDAKHALLSLEQELKFAESDDEDKKGVVENADQSTTRDKAANEVSGDTLTGTALGAARAKAAAERKAREEKRREQIKARKKAKREQAKRERAARKKKREEEHASLVSLTEKKGQDQWRQIRSEVVAMGKLKAVGETLFQGKGMTEDEQKAVLHEYEREMKELDLLMAATDAEAQGRDRGGNLFAAAMESDVFSGGISEEALRATFDAIDEDGSGELDEEEISNLLVSLGHGADPTEVSELIELADEDGNGVIDFEEFKVMARELQRRRAKNKEMKKGKIK
eukprot:g1072.t1